MLRPAAPGGPVLRQLFTRNSVLLPFNALKAPSTHLSRNRSSSVPFNSCTWKKVFQMTAEETIMGSKNLVGDNSNVELLIRYAKYFQKQQGIGKKRNKTKCCIYCKRVWTQRINVSSFKTGIWLSNLLSTDFRFASFLNTCSVKDVSARLRQELNISAFRKETEKTVCWSRFLEFLRTQQTASAPV